MDKFGIFNLLNSFFPLNFTKKGQSGAGDGASELTNNLFSTLGKNLFNGTNAGQKNQQNNANEISKQTVPLPLQKNMLSTINSHDEIVKRVKGKYNLPKWLIKNYFACLMRKH